MYLPTYYSDFTCFIFSIFATMKNNFPESWQTKLNKTHWRALNDFSDKIDFASNDYLGFAKNEKVKEIVTTHFDELKWKGGTGSRLISGNKKIIEDIEQHIASLHNAENVLIFPSAYQANVGLFSSIAGKNDLFLIDEHIHASIIDGVRLSFATDYKFKHNDLQHLNALINKHYQRFQNIFVVTEGLFSMDGDSPDVNALLNLIDGKKVFLIMDEAHSFGILGKNKLGIFNEYADYCLARIVGYGKALGFSGGAIIGNNALKKYLVNFCRPFIYSTALPVYHYQIIFYLYEILMKQSEKEQQTLQSNIEFYLQQVDMLKNFSKNQSPIQYMFVRPDTANAVQQEILNNGFYAKVIFPPTVKQGSERVRISLHSFNTHQEITTLINLLKKFNE